MKYESYEICSCHDWWDSLINTPLKRLPLQCSDFAGWATPWSWSSPSSRRWAAPSAGWPGNDGNWPVKTLLITFLTTIHPFIYKDKLLWASAGAGRSPAMITTYTVNAYWFIKDKWVTDGANERSEDNSNRTNLRKRCLWRGGGAHDRPHPPTHRQPITACTQMS